MNYTAARAQIKSGDLLAWSHRVPFTASQHDPEAHGRAIFASIVAGKYGPIGEYVAPPLLQAQATPASGQISQSVL